MKIATYNVRNLFDPGTRVDDRSLEVVDVTFFNTRVAYFTKVLQEAQLDIVCFQEIGGTEGVRLLAEALGYEYFLAKPNTRGIRMGIVYKKELGLICESISLGDLQIPDLVTQGDAANLSPISQRRDILVADYTSASGKAMRIVAFHLKSLIPSYLEGEDMETDERAYTDAKFRSVFCKMMELRALRSFATKSLTEGKELIMLGDFNEHNNGSCLDILKGSAVETHRLSDILVGHTGDVTTLIYRGAKLTFDTMLVSQGIKETITAVSVENKELRDYSELPPGSIEHEIESDHAMVTLTVSL